MFGPGAGGGDAGGFGIFGDAGVVVTHHRNGTEHEPVLSGILEFEIEVGIPVKIRAVVGGGISASITEGDRQDGICAVKDGDVGVVVLRPGGLNPPASPVTRFWYTGASA